MILFLYLVFSLAIIKTFYVLKPDLFNIFAKIKIYSDYFAYMFKLQIFFTNLYRNQEKLPSVPHPPSQHHALPLRPDEAAQQRQHRQQGDLHRVCGSLVHFVHLSGNS